MKGCYYKLLFLNNYFKYFFFHLGDAVGQTGDFIWVQGKEHRKLLKWVEEIYKFKKSLPCTGFHQTSGKFALYSYRAWFEANSSGMKAGKYKPAKQSNAADSLIEAQLLFVVYRHIKVTTLDVLLRFLLLNVLLRTGRVSSSYILSWITSAGPSITSLPFPFSLQQYPVLQDRPALGRRRVGSAGGVESRLHRGVRR